MTTVDMSFEEFVALVGQAYKESVFDYEWCESPSPSTNWVCSLPIGHTGFVHVAVSLKEVLDVWPNKNAFPKDSDGWW